MQHEKPQQEQKQPHGVLALVFRKPFELLAEAALGGIFGFAGHLIAKHLDPWRASYRTLLAVFAAVAILCAIVLVWLRLMDTRNKWIEGLPRPRRNVTVVLQIALFASVAFLVFGYWQWFATQYLIRVDGIETIALVVEQNSTEATESETELRKLLRSKANVRIVSYPLPDPPPSMSTGGRTALETYRLNRGYLGAFRVTSESSHGSSKITIEKTPHLVDWPWYQSMSEYPVSIDTDDLVSINLLEHISIHKCQTKKSTQMLELTTGWLNGNLEQRLPLLLDRPAYLTCLLESYYLDSSEKYSMIMSEVRAQLKQNPDKVPKDPASVLTLAIMEVAELLITREWFDRAQEVLEYQLTSLQGEELADALRMLGELSLARFQVETDYEQQEQHLANAEEDFGKAIELAPHDPYSHFGLGRTNLLTAQREQTTPPPKELMDSAIDSLNTALSESTLPCQRRDVQLWRHAVYILSDRPREANAALHDAQEEECRENSLTALIMPCGATDKALKLLFLLPKPKDGYWVSVACREDEADASERIALQPIELGASVFSTTLDLGDLFEHRFDSFVYDTETTQLRAIKVCRILLYDSQIGRHALVDKYPLVLAGKPHLAVTEFGESPLVLSSGEYLTVSARIEEPLREYHIERMTLTDQQILAQLTFHVRFPQQPMVEEMPMDQSGDPGQFTVSFDPHDKVGEGGDLGFEIVVYDFTSFDEEDVREEVLISSQTSFTMATPSPTPTFTPTPTPTPVPPPAPTPDLREEWVAVLNSESARIYQEPSFDAPMLPLPEVSPIAIIIREPQAESVGSWPDQWVNADWYKIDYIEGQAVIPGWIPDGSIASRARRSHHELLNCAVSITPTNLYADLVSTSPVADPIPQDSLLFIIEEAEGRFLVRAHTATGDYRRGWVTGRDIVRHPFPQDIWSEDR